MIISMKIKIKNIQTSSKPGSVLMAISLGHIVPQAAYPRALSGDTLARLFGLAPSRVYQPLECYHSRRWALTPPFHPYPLKGRSGFCGTFHRIAPPGSYPVLSPLGARTFLRSIWLPRPICWSVFLVILSVIQNSIYYPI